MVAHLAPRVNPPVAAFTDQREDRTPCQTVGVVAVDILTPVATRGYVIQGAGNFKTERTGLGPLPYVVFFKKYRTPAKPEKSASCVHRIA